MVSMSHTTDRRQHGDRRHLSRRLAVLWYMARRQISWLFVEEPILAFRRAWKADTKVPEFQLAAGLLIYGTWMALPFETITPPLVLLSRVMPEWIPGACLIAIGRFGLHALAEGGEAVRCRATRLVFSVLLVLFLLTVVVNWRSLATPVFLWAALRALWVNRCVCSGKTGGKC